MPQLRRVLWTALSVLLFLTAVVPPARAQFNGPPTSSDNSNSAVPTADSRLLNPSTPESLLQPGDEITIRLFGIADYNYAGRISTDGTILLPLVGIVHLQDLSITQAELFLARKLQDAGQYRDPQVILTLAPGANATIAFTGELHTVVPVVGSRNLLAALAAAGGLPLNASRTLTILRPGQPVPISVELGNDPLHSAKANIPLFAGDIVVVSRIGVIYVSGEFHTPSVVPMTNYGPLTLSQVSAMAGGPLQSAKYDALHIVRTVGDHRTVTTVDLKKVLYGKAPDPIMQPNDIVFLPASAIKTALTNGTLGSILGIFSVAIATIYSVR